MDLRFANNIDLAECKNPNPQVSFPDKIKILRWKKLEAWLGCHSAENTMSENKLQEKTKKQTSGSHIPALGTSELPGKWL